MNTSLPKKLLKTCIFRRSNGVYYFRKQVGRRRRICSLKTTDEEEALALASREYDMLASGHQHTGSGTSLNPDMKLKEAAELFKSTKTPKSDASRTFHAEMAEYVLRHFGEDTQVSKIDLVSAQRYISGLHQRYTASTVGHRGKFLKGMYKYLAMAGIIRENPLVYLKLPKYKPGTPLFLDREEIPDFLKAVNDYCRLFCYVAIKTGMRKGEILNLTWGMVDFRNGLIRLEGKATKNGEGRDIPMDDELRQALQTHRIEQGSELPWVFLNEAKDGRRKYLRHGVEKAFGAIGRNDLTFHCLRKTFATHYLEANHNDLWGLMKIGGWKDIKTVEIYVGLTKRVQEDRRQRIHQAMDIGPFPQPD